MCQRGSLWGAENPPGARLLCGGAFLALAQTLLKSVAAQTRGSQAQVAEAHRGRIALEPDPRFPVALVARLPDVRVLAAAAKAPEG